MSDSIPTQWISQYIINVAETFGKSFTEIPIDDITPAKKKRVQIIEFLTYNEDSAIWGRVSDKESVIPVCFTKAAVKQYMKVLQGRRLTEAKNAIFHIGQLRPTFTPIPVGNNRPKLTEEPHIALEAGVVVYIGPGMGVYGSPHDVESHTKVRAWVRGLRRGGDGGDVLKCRKQHTKDIANSPPVHEIHPVTDRPDALPKPQIQQTERGSRDIIPEPPVQIPEPFREYRKRWIHVEKNRWLYMKPYIDDKMQDEQPQLGRLSVQESRDININTKPQPCTPPRTHTPEQDIAKQTTPRISEWSPSECGSPLGVLPCIHPDDRTTPPPSADKNVILSEPYTPPATSPLQPPTPAQQIRRSSPHSPSIAPQPSSISVHIRKDMVRRVPRPGLPPSPTDGSGPAKILVPNSDISGTQSQSQPRSQSLPESQLNRLVFPSQLTQEFKPGKTSTPAAVKQGRAASEMPPGGHPESRLVVNRASSTGFTASDIHEGFSHNDHQLSDTNPDAQQTMEASVAELSDASIDAVNGDHIVAEAPGEQSNGLKHITTPSLTPLHSPTHSLFSCPSTSQSQVIPNVISRETSPDLAEPIASTSRNLLHDAEGWKEPSFMSARKGKGRETELDEKRHETHKRKRLSPRLSSPFTQKRRKILDEKITESHEAEEPTSPVSNKKADHIDTASNLRRKESSSIKQLSLGRGSRDLTQPQSSSPGVQQLGQKKRRTRLLGYEVDFNHPPAGRIPNTWMNMRQIRTILLRTGRIRTLGDEVTRDKRIYTKSE